MGVWSPASATVTGTAEPEQVRTVEISDGILQSLRVRPARGHGFTAADHVPGGTATVLLSHGCWERKFGAVLWPVMGTIAVVMLIVSANVAGLVLVRMQARRSEQDTRRARGRDRATSFVNS